MWDENGRLLIQKRIIGSLQIIYPHFIENFPKNVSNFSGNVFLFDSHKFEVRVMFLQFSENCPTTPWRLYNKAPINQLFVPYGKYSDLSFLYESHFIRSVL